MSREKTIERIKELQRQIRGLRQTADSPAIERSMQLMEMYCHMARWELGDIQEMLPELEEPSGDAA